MTRDARMLVMVLVLAGLGLIVVPMSGCAAPRADQGRFRVEAGGYEDAFSRAREVLIDMGYRLDRVDGRAGVLTTHRRQASLVHPDWIIVEVRFVPSERYGRLPSDTPGTQIDPVSGAAAVLLGDGAVVGEVTAVRERVYRPRFQPQPVDALRSGRVTDELLVEQLGGRELIVPMERETDVEDRVAGRIAQRLGRQSAAPEG